ncbi:MAG: geranylgeranylglycerol-phosphate geranylgeranyltransferase [Bacteroidetes bacterium]|nr:geranylgeranylglycerol-phosphate geranylgeranyltransferase [Bacteroidota bacterium]
MKPYITLIRPVNFVITALSIFVACLLAGGTQAQLLVMVFASLSGALIGSGGMVINDIIDVEIDRINKPDRPIPSGAVDRYDAMMFYGALTGAGLIMSAYTTRSAFIIAFIAAPVIVMYSKGFKGTPLFGNLIVAALTGLAFIYGGAVVGNIRQAVMPAVFAFLINVGREVIKDMEDVEGDAKNGASTLPVRYGMQAAAATATIFLLSVIASTFIPYLNGQYGISYLVTVNAGVNLVLVYVLVSLWKDRSVQNLHRLSNILKWDMLVGLAAIYLG